MALKLLVDECIQDKLLVAKLRAAGHDVKTVLEAGLLRKPDHTVFEAAIAEDRLVITINCADFIALHETKVNKNGSHPGVLLVYRHNDPTKEMTHDDTVNAIKNLEESGLALDSLFHSLNSYCWSPGSKH